MKKTKISLKSFLNKNFTIDDLEISTQDIKLKDAVAILRTLKNSPELFILDKIIKDGFLVASFKLNFDNEGKIKENYQIKGIIKEGKVIVRAKNVYIVLSSWGIFPPKSNLFTTK